MHKVKIYTYSHNRPDLIAHQYESMKKYIKDDFEFIVFNNEIPGGDPGSGYSEERKEEIFKVCKDLNLKCIMVELEKEFEVLNGVRHVIDNHYTGGSEACGYAFNWGWKRYASKDEGIVVLIDSDMFFIKEICFNDIVKNTNFCFVPSYRQYDQYKNSVERGTFAYSYAWNGFVIALPSKMPSPEEINWGVGYVKNIFGDVGVHTFYYLNKNLLSIKYLDMITILDSNLNDKIKISLNGSIVLEIPKQEFFKEEDCIIYGGAQFSGQKTYEHQTERNDYWNYLYQNSQFIMNNIVNKFNFPSPEFIDLIKFEKDSIEDSFIFHYKNASNSNSWMNEEYNDKKTKALKNLLNYYVYN